MAEELYQETLIARAKSGRERKRLPNPDGTATLDNPLCGDRVTLDITFRPADEGASETAPSDQTVIGAVGHDVRGCMLCEATAAMIAAYAPGMTQATLAEHADSVRTMITDGSPPPADWPDFQALAAVHGTKSRHHCVLLAFDVLEKGLANAGLPRPSDGADTSSRGASPVGSDDPVRPPPF